MTVELGHELLEAAYARLSEAGKARAARLAAEHPCLCLTELLSIYYRVRAEEAF